MYEKQIMLWADVTFGRPRRPSTGLPNGSRGGLPRTSTIGYMGNDLKNERQYYNTRNRPLYRPLYAMITKKIICLICLTLFSSTLTACHKLLIQTDKEWSKPLIITKTKGGLADKTFVYKYSGVVFLLQELDDATARCFILKTNDYSWSEVHFVGIPKGYSLAYPSINPLNGITLFDNGYTENNALELSVIIGQITPRLDFQDTTEIKCAMTTTDIFGSDVHNMRFTEWNNNGRRGWLQLGLGLADNSEFCIPFGVEAFTCNENGDAIKRGPYMAGMFCLDTFNKAWRVERIANFNAFDPSCHRTKDSYYYFAAGSMENREGWKLWYSRKTTNTGPWDSPEPITETFAYGSLGHYATDSSEDTAHICWMDSRHNMWRFNIDGPVIENDDIMYSHRRDSDGRWRADMILSKGISYCYDPCISVDGNRIVVAWAGIQSAGKYHTDYDPNDIYYVTSKDGGNTWAEPLKVTDGAKDGMTAGEPKVMLLNGVIHLFYIEGKNELQEVGPGMVKVNQPPWPIYYTQRPFPN